jgi:hypothetical protein
LHDRPTSLAAAGAGENALDFHPVLTFRSIPVPPFDIPTGGRPRAISPTRATARKRFVAFSRILLIRAKKKEIVTT